MLAIVIHADRHPAFRRGIRKRDYLLGGLADFVEILLKGHQDFSSIYESGHRLLAHLAELDSECFRTLEQGTLMGVDKATVHS